MTSRIFFAALLLSSVAYADRMAVPEPAADPNAGARPMAVRPHTPPVPGVVAPMPPRPPAPATPPPLPIEIATVGKQQAGTYRCKGNAATPSGASVPLEAVLVIKLDLDNSWIFASWVAKTGKLVEYSTYDGTAHQWKRIQMRDDASHAVLTSLGEKAGEWLWDGAAVSQTGTVQERNHEQLTGKDLKLWGEVQLGGTWQKSYEVSCKR